MIATDCRQDGSNLVWLQSENQETVTKGYEASPWLDRYVDAESRSLHRW